MSQLTPTQLIKKAIVQRINEQNYGDFRQPVETGEQIDAAYDLAVKKHIHWDFNEEIRSSGIDTPEIPSKWSRHCEYDSVAQLFDNQWVGWQFEHGGGKHHEVDPYGWMEDAYFLDCEEKQVTITQRTFTKK